MTLLSVDNPTAHPSTAESLPRPGPSLDGAGANTRQRRILFVDHTASLGGGEIALLNLVRHLDVTRYRPIVALFSDGPLVARLRDAGVETHIIPLDQSVLHTRKDAIGASTLLSLGVIGRTLKQVLRLKRFAQSHHVDLIHTNSLKADIIGGFAARWARIPAIWHVRDRITRDYLPGSVVRIFRLLARVFPTCVVANSKATLQTLRLGQSQPTAVIYSGIEFQSRNDSLHEHVDPEMHVPIIGLVGRITRWKGQDVFLRAASEVLKRFPRARFQVIGAALFSELDFEREVKDLAQDLGINASVEFTGFREDVANLTAKLDVLVHASTTGEPFGQVIVEGMAAGKPVVATDGGGVPEIVVHEETGLLVPMNDPSAMAAAICRILAAPAWARTMGERGRKRVQDHFTVQQSVDELQGLYDDILGCTRLDAIATH